jgi:hypothetical protein
MMKFYFVSLLLAASSISPLAVLASDAGSSAVSGMSSSTQVTDLTNPSNHKIVGSDRTTFDTRHETGAMTRTSKVKSITHGGDSSVPIDRMPAGNPLGGSGVSTGAKIPGPSGVINHKNELPATKNEIEGGAVAAPGS